MNLRRKLLTTFGILALLGLVVAGVSIWATVQWDRTNEQVDEHYLRSLQIQRIRAATFQAFKEIPDALVGGDENAQQEFDDALEPIEKDFKLWASLARTEEEKQQVAEVRDSYDVLVGNAREFFELVENGNREEAVRLAEGTLEDKNFEDFEAATEKAVASDRDYRETVRAQNENTRRTAQLVLIIAAFGTVSLLLLVAAYLAADLFRPLRDVEDALKDVERGDLDRRLNEERSDELGAVGRAFNRMVAAIAERERTKTLVSDSTDEDGNGAAWRNTPSRVTLHRLVSQIRSRISHLETDGVNGDASGQQQNLVGQLDRLSQAVARVTEFGFPLDLNLARSDIRELLYEVVIRFQGEFAERAVSLDLEIDPAVDYAVVDRLKLREALSELVRNALAALPERGGHLGLRARVAEDDSELLVEVADDGAGAEQSLIDDAFDFSEDDDEDPQTGLVLTKAIVEHHGGSLEIESIPAEGTYVQIRLPLRS
ncbi:MAG: ATP-binding protein [Rubrobacteraceae bacterium]